jgi:hypothetical protein
MREQVLRDYFEGKVTATKLAKDVRGSMQNSGGITSLVSIEDMDHEFTITSGMAVRLCDDFLSGELSPNDLHTIGFALMASDKFDWDGDEDEVLAHVIADWSAPEVNYPLTSENVQKCQAWLTRTESLPPRPPLSAEGGKIISIVEKKSSQPLWKRFRRWLARNLHTTHYLKMRL